MERILRRIHPNRQEAHLLPLRHHKRKAVRNKNIRSTSNTLFPGQFVLRMGQLQVLRLAKRDRIHPSLRPVQHRHVPIRSDAERADLRVAQHAERTPAGGGQQAGSHRPRGRHQQ